MHRLQKLTTFIMGVCLVFMPAVSSSAEFTHTEIDYKLCFTPPQNCTGLIVDTINHATKSIYVQAYSFTSAPIMHALSAAQSRGVEVKVLLDKSQKSRKSNSASIYLRSHNIPVWIDDEPDIAHNKVMILDEATVITGSFNFTNAAQFRNAENVIVIKNDEIAKRYLANWQYRLASSRSTRVLKVFKPSMIKKILRNF
jgi:phosphatidylserine/phosphatidylglycerophosphate/cardiolipin synthase-like enzyme